jgi:type II secretory pathway pseudopilin PulG
MGSTVQPAASGKTGYAAVRVGLRVAVALLAILGAAVVARAQPEGAPASETRSEQAAVWLIRQLESELRQRIGDEKALPLRDYPFHFVFLIDSSQASAKSAYPQFARQTIARFLHKVEERQHGRSDGRQSLASIYPYQTELYLGEPYSVERLPLTKPNIERLVAKVPGATIPTLPDGRTPIPSRGGHDHATARMRVMQAVAGPGYNPSVPALFIQFTTISINELPGDPERDRAMRALGGQTGLLEETDFIAYSVQGLPLKTDDPGPGLAPFDVYIWTYGPPVLVDARPLPTATTGATAAAPPRPRSLAWLWFLVVAAALVAAAAYVLMLVAKPRPVVLERGGQTLWSYNLKPGGTVEIWGPGATPEHGAAYVLPQDVAPGMPPKKLAKLHVPMFGPASLEPELCETQKPGRQGGGPIAVERGKKEAVQLVLAHQKTALLHVTVG